jgi:ATP-dependent DNA helicase RecG
MDIEQLITQKESKVLEFKSDLSSLTTILKTIVAFANTAGGIMIIGISPSGALLGIKTVLREEERLANAIADSIHPPLLPEIEISTVGGKDLLIVKIAHWKGPFYVKKEGFPKGVYVRLGSTSRPAEPEILSELQRTIISPSFDQEPVPNVAKDSLDFEKIDERFSRLGKKIDKEKMLSMGILVPHGRSLVPSIGGLILFGKSEDRERLFPDAKVRCARFLGESKANILDSYEVQGSILDAIDEVPKFIARNTRLAARIDQFHRTDIPEYPPIAIREVLVNALVHADYSIQGSHIQIAIYDNRLEIQNPGMLPFGFTLDDLKAGVSRIRNRVIARVFHELKWMESWGSGYRRSLEACQWENYPLPEWEEWGTTLRVTFYSRQQTILLGESRVLYQVEEEPIPRQKKLLSLFQKGEVLAFREISQLLKSVPERTLRYDLALLRKKGRLISLGKGRSTVWKRFDRSCDQSIQKMRDGVTLGKKLSIRKMIEEGRE